MDVWRSLPVKPSGNTTGGPKNAEHRHHGRGQLGHHAAAAVTRLVKALARAFHWLRMLETGRDGTTDELASAEKINSSCVQRLLPPTLLAPDIVEAILDGRQPGGGITLPALIEPFPVAWGRQR